MITPFRHEVSKYQLPQGGYAPSVVAVIPQMLDRIEQLEEAIKQYVLDAKITPNDYRRDVLLITKKAPEDV